MKSIAAALAVLLSSACQSVAPVPSAGEEAIAGADPSPAAVGDRQAGEVRIDRAHIDQVLRGFVDDGRAVGVSALVYAHGREAYFGAFGMADREAGRAMARDTLAQVYSMTKPVTGVVLMTLYEEGRFRLDDPLSKYLPEFAGVRVYAGQDADGAPRYEAPRRPVLVRDILRHTSGFAADADDTPVGRMVAKADLYDGRRTLAQLSETVAGLPLLFQPGTQWRYGPSVDVQARLAERLAGKPYAQLVRERVLEPLRMRDTAYLVPPASRGRMSAMYAYEHGRFERMPDAEAFERNFNAWALTPGGMGLVSSLDDYMRFARMLAGGGALDGVRILKPETVRLMATDALPPGIAERAWLPSKGRVGFGIDFAVRVAPPADADEASGAVGEFFWDGYANTLFWVDPANDIAAVLFTQYVPPGGTDLHKRFRDAVYVHDPRASSARRRPPAGGVR